MAKNWQRRLWMAPNRIFIFHKTEVPTVILTCLTGLTSDWFKVMTQNVSFVKDKNLQLAKRRARHGSKLDIYQLIFFEG